MLEHHLSNPQIPFEQPPINPEPDAPSTPPSPGIPSDLPMPTPPGAEPDMPGQGEPDPEVPDPDSPASR